ncbi:MAG: ABC transporter ATP-binding protein [Ruminococcus sp.]|nr:ABC transporter ATP-binding protein [Ruminococcus sp.]
MEQGSILKANGISAGYGKKIIVSGLSFTAVPGEIVSLIGPNGAGKSTILRSISAQMKLSGGNVTVGGKDLSDMPLREIAGTVSVCFTDRIYTERMTCEDIVSAGRYPYTGKLGILSAEDRKIVRDAMEMTGISSLAETDIRYVSDGQRQTVMLARAVAQQPDVLILDEPTSFLDINNKLRLLAILKELASERNITVIQTLHELDLAQRFSDRLICIKDGRADRTGTPDEIFSGDYIDRLYGISAGSFEPLYGTAEASCVTGEPEVFVIGGGGKGIPVYRSLQRKGIPFAAGVIHENDIEYPVAARLAAEVISEKAFEPVSGENTAKAAEIMKKCRKVICCTESFGTMNSGNKLLLEEARNAGKIIFDTDDIVY